MFKCCIGRHYSRIDGDEEGKEGEIWRNNNKLVNGRTPGIIDLIVLGPSECGKSTVMRHMVYMAKGNYDENERENIVNTIRANILEGVKNLIKGMEKLSINFENPKNKERSDTFMGIHLSSAPTLSEDQINEMREMLKDNGIKEVLKKVNQFTFNYAFLYFVDVFHLKDPVMSPNIIDGLERIFDPKYVPTIDDAVHMRRRTIGHTQETFVFKGVTFRITDVGGERQARIHWNPLIKDALMIIFVAALSDYDLTLKEDGRSNRMEDALILFRVECSREDLKHKSFFLFLNKLDVFRKKIRKVPLSRYFEDYKGPGDLSSSLKFIKGKFLAESGERSKKGMIHVHYTTATDKGSLEKVFVAVKDTVIRIISKRTLL